MNTTTYKLNSCNTFGNVIKYPSQVKPITVTGNSTFQPERYVVTCVMRLRPAGPFIVQTKWHYSRLEKLHLF